MWLELENRAKESETAKKIQEENRRIEFLKTLETTIISKQSYSSVKSKNNSETYQERTEETVDEDILSHNNNKHHDNQDRLLAKSESLKYELKVRAKNQNNEIIGYSQDQLPILKVKDQIIDLIQKHFVLIVCGETGSGKSTQIPQIILKHQINSLKGSSTQIICTQPRRISATSIASRVSEEMGDGPNNVGKHGSLVGHIVRLESKVSSTTKLTFCTTGILLRRLESEPNLDSISHVIVDEVHGN